MDAAPIRTARLDLVLLTRAVMVALLDGRDDLAAAAIGAPVPHAWPDEDDRALLALRVADLAGDAAAEPWLLRAMVARDPAPVMVGHVGFHGPPGRHRAGVELGYATFPEHRRRGFAEEAVRAMAAAAHAHGVRPVVASVAPANAPSLALVRKLGFVQTGTQWDDEDGLELVFELAA